VTQTIFDFSLIGGLLYRIISS